MSPQRGGGSRPAEHTLDNGGIALNYAEISGDGPDLLMLHGLGARWQVFAPLFPGLRDHANLWAMDFRGHGTSGRTPGAYRLEDYCDDALALLRRTRTPSIVYGHSLGGWVALSLAAEHPDLVRAVIVADSAVFPEHIDPDLAVSYLSDLPLALRSVAKSLRQLDPDVMAHFRDGRLTENYRPTTLLPRVTCPALLIQGDPGRGALMTDADVRQAMVLLPRGRHVKFTSLGHGLHVEDAGGVLETVLRFLKAL
ncbi:alpha/beta fold hydrolase [Nonomuraea insulae]|uniref:Alpha/beta fold hydrolase n=1 Tax=Nonomuraea insulae TaxID=1616787 RepID=A0ABW1CPT5_9ACTN